MFWLHVCMCTACITHNHRCQKAVSDPPIWNYIDHGYLVGTGNRIQVFCKNGALKCLVPSQSTLTGIDHWCKLVCFICRLQKSWFKLTETKRTFRWLTARPELRCRLHWAWPRRFSLGSVFEKSHLQNGSGHLSSAGWLYPRAHSPHGQKCIWYL